MNRIQLTGFGEMMIAKDSSGITKMDGNILPKANCTIGVHEFCRGWIDRQRIAPLYDVVLCRACGLRLAIPNTISTYGQLREFINNTYLRK